MAVQIGFDPDFRPSGGSRPELPEATYDALVDTGASESCIDSSLAEALKLPVVERQPVAGVHGADEVNLHLAQIYVPDLALFIYGRFAGVHLRAGGQPHLALIGRTFLSSVQLHYDGPTGSTVIVKP